MTRVFEAVIENSLADFGRFAAELDHFLAEAGIGPEVSSHINLSVEELITNTISYGYPDGRAGQIRFRLDPAEPIDILITDDADPFDPFSAAEPDLGASLDDRAIGGLGVFFVKQFMDSFEYAAQAGGNSVRLRKTARA